MNDVEVHRIDGVSTIFKSLAQAEQQECTKLLVSHSHPEINHGLTNAGYWQYWYPANQPLVSPLLHPSHQDLLEYAPVLYNSVLNQVGVIILLIRFVRNISSIYHHQRYETHPGPGVLNWLNTEQLEWMWTIRIPIAWPVWRTIHVLIWTPVHINSLESARENTLDLVWTYVEKVLLDKKECFHCEWINNKWQQRRKHHIGPYICKLYWTHWHLLAILHHSCI